MQAASHGIWSGGLTMLLIVLSSLSYGQISQPARYEREQKNNDQDFIMISMHESGIALIRDKEKYKEGKQLWELIRLDTALQEVWMMELDIENRHRLVGYEFKDNVIHLLYRDGEHEANDLTLFTIHAITQDIHRYLIKQELSFRVTHFCAMTGNIALGGYVSNEPAVLLYNLETEKAKLVPGFFVSDTELLDLRVNTNNTFNTLIAERTNKQNKFLVLKTFDSQGALLLEDQIEIDPKLTILTGLTSTLINDEMLLAGTWTEGNSKQASGIYTTLVDPFNNQPIHYYDFGQFNHFLDYLSAKRAASVKQKSAQAKKLGIVPDFKTYAAPMRLAEQPEGFALLSEVYLPATSLNTYPSWNYGMPYYGYSAYGYNSFTNRYYNSPYQYNSTNTGDTKMLHTSFMIFDRQGELIQDYGIKLDNKKMVGMVEQTADFIYYEDCQALAYKKEKEIFLVGTLPDGSVLADTIQSESQSPTDFIKYDSDQNTAIRFWYKTNFYVWGYQSIRNKSEGVDDPNRYVFYINKVEIH